MTIITQTKAYKSGIKQTRQRADLKKKIAAHPTTISVTVSDKNGRMAITGTESDVILAMCGLDDGGWGGSKP